MTLDWQTIVALVIVGVTLAVFLIGYARTKKRGGCGHNCGCDHETTFHRVRKRS
jgi:hypothetical protein